MMIWADMRQSLFRFWLVVVLAVNCAGWAAAGDTYSWRDSGGRLHFSDRPPADGLAHDLLSIAPLWSPGEDRPGDAPIQEQTHLAEEITVARPSSKRPKKIIHAGDYDLSPTILVSGRELSVRGRINGGPECASLKLRFVLKNEQGRAVAINTLVENAGGAFGSTIYVGTSRLKKSSYGQQWVVVERQAVCE